MKALSLFSGIGGIDLADEGLIIGKIVIRGKEGDNAFRIHFAKTHQTVKNRRCRTPIGRLDQQAGGCHPGNLIGIERLVRSRQH